MASQQEAGIKASPDRKPSARQVYCVAHLMADVLELKWPESRADASELIGQLRELQAKAKGGNDVSI